MSHKFFHVAEDEVGETVPASLIGIDYILTAISQRGHTCLLIIDHPEKTIYYLDPISGFISMDQISANMSVINSFKNKVFQDDDEPYRYIYNENFEHHTGKQLPSQTGSADCGILVCLYALFIMSGKTMEFDSDARTMTKARRWFQRLIWKLRGEIMVAQYISWQESLLIDRGMLQMDPESTLLRSVEYRQIEEQTSNVIGPCNQNSLNTSVDTVHSTLGIAISTSLESHESIYTRQRKSPEQESPQKKRRTDMKFMEFEIDDDGNEHLQCVLPDLKMETESEDQPVVIRQLEMAPREVERSDDDKFNEAVLLADMISEKFSTQFEQVPIGPIGNVAPSQLLRELNIRNTFPDDDGYWQENVLCTFICHSDNDVRTLNELSHRENLFAVTALSGPEGYNEPLLPIASVLVSDIRGVHNAIVNFLIEISTVDLRQD